MSLNRELSEELYLCNEALSTWGGKIKVFFSEPLLYMPHKT